MSKKKSDPLLPFVPVQRDLLQSKEFRSLSKSAMILYIYIRSKVRSRGQFEVILTYSEMSDILSSQTMSNAIKQLIEQGFIVKTEQGGRYGFANKYKFVGAFYSPYKNDHYHKRVR